MILKVVKINAVWCSGCLVMNKIWNKVLKEYDIETIHLDYDLDEEEVQKYSPGNILPVFIFYDNNQEVYRVIGEKSEKEMLEIVRSILNEKNN